MNYKYDANTIGRKIRNRRLQLGWSQEDLGMATDMERSEICKYENGKIEYMRTDTLMRFCNALDLTLNDMACLNAEEYSKEISKLSEPSQYVVKTVIRALYVLERDERII